MDEATQIRIEFLEGRLTACQQDTEKWRSEALAAHKANWKMSKAIYKAVKRIRENGIAYIEFDALIDFVKEQDISIPF